MSGFFNPANPRFRRGVVLTSIVACTFATCQIVLADFGSQEHILSPLQRMIIPKVDEFFNVTAAELKIDSNSANKDKAFVRVVSPLMPKVPQKEPVNNNTTTSSSSNNTNSNNTTSSSNSNSTSSSNTSASSTEKKRGWLW